MYPAKVRPVLWARSQCGALTTPVRWQSTRLLNDKTRSTHIASIPVRIGAPCPDLPCGKESKCHVN